MKLLHVFVILCLLVMPAFMFAQGAAPPAGMIFPTSGTVFAVDGEKSTEPVQLHPSEIVSNSHAGSNFARGMVYSGPRASVELDGLNAAIHLTSDRASFLVRLSGDEAELLRGRVTLIRLKQGGKRRVVSTFSQNIFGGQRTRAYDVVAVTKTDVPDSSWLKLTPNAPLPPGEYGIVFLPKDAWLFADTVYDFDVNFDAAKPEAKGGR